jgi:hypothetical protein
MLVASIPSRIFHSEGGPSSSPDDPTSHEGHLVHWNTVANFSMREISLFPAPSPEGLAWLQPFYAGTRLENSGNLYKRKIEKYD